MTTTPNDPNSGGYGGAPSYGSAPSGGGGGTNVMGIIALVVGILGAVLAFCTGGIAGIIGGLVAIILGFLGRKKAKRGEVGGGGLALGGLIVGVVSLVIGIGVLVFAAFIFNKVGDCTDPNLSEAEVQQCVEDNLGS